MYKVNLQGLFYTGPDYFDSLCLCSQLHKGFDLNVRLIRSVFLFLFFITANSKVCIKITFPRKHTFLVAYTPLKPTIKSPYLKSLKRIYYFLQFRSWTYLSRCGNSESSRTFKHKRPHTGWCGKVYGSGVWKNVTSFSSDQQRSSNSSWVQQT